MNDLIIQALNGAYEKAEKNTPQTKKVEKTIRILDVKPIELPKFMRENNIPDDADFCGVDNGYDGWNDFVLCWYVDAPLTESEQLENKKKRFTYLAYKSVYDLLTNNGYKRVPVDSSVFKAYSEASLFEMFMKKDFDWLATYYSFYFKKDLDN